jgi:RNA 3'-terminal phosphate cyclase (ATP)
MLLIDGSQGEGGGQVLRTALSLSLVTGKPFRIERIRARRRTPGLRPQYFTAVSAAKAVARAEVVGATVGSQELSFAPRDVVPGNYRFDVGTAGSTILVLETLLPALVVAARPSSLILEGGTHNPSAPPYDFFRKAFMPIIARMGPSVMARIERFGFYPAGGGRVCIDINPVPALNRINLTERGELVDLRARVLCANVATSISERELDVISRKLSWKGKWLRAEQIHEAKGTGNIVMIEVESRHVTEVFAAFGKGRIRPQAVAEHAVRATRRYLATGVPVGEHLADQLLIPMAMAGGGSFRTFPPSRHTLTNMAVIERFLDISITHLLESNRVCRVQVERTPCSLR